MKKTFSNFTPRKIDHSSNHNGLFWSENLHLSSLLFIHLEISHYSFITNSSIAQITHRGCVIIWIMFRCLSTATKLTQSRNLCGQVSIKHSGQIIYAFKTFDKILVYKLPVVKFQYVLKMAKCPIFHWKYPTV